MLLGGESGSSGTYYLSGGSLEAGDLDINNGWMDIDVSGIDLFAVHGDRVGLLDGYIADGKIFDSTLCPDGYLYAVYDPDNDWTTLNAIPEPTALLLLVPGILGIAIRVKGRRRKD